MMYNVSLSRKKERACSNGVAIVLCRPAVFVLFASVLHFVTFLPSRGASLHP